MATNTPSKKLYDLLVTKNYPDLEFYDTKTGQPPVEGLADADLFTFKWTPSSGKNYGTATILFGDENNLKFYFGDNLARGIEDPTDKQELYDFQHQLKQFATAHRLDFDLDDISKLKYALAGQAKMTESIFEGWNGTKTTSWTDRPDAVRLMIRHQRPLGEGDARHRYIESLFVETTDGERYKLPFKKLAGGRAMVEHVRQGGRPYDPRGQHIAEMVEELNVLSRFRRANHGRIFEGEANVLVTETQAYYETLRHAMKSIASGRGYQNYFESWNPAAITEQNIMIDDIKKMFVEQSIDSRIEQALPMLVKIKQGHDMKQADIFEAWVDEITEGDQSSDSLLHTEEQQDELVELLSKELPVGAYAANTAPVMDLLVNAPEDWLDDLTSELKELAETDPDADARQVITDRLQELAKDANIISVLNRLESDQEPTYQDPDADADEPDQEPTYQDPDADDKQFDDIDEDTGSMSRIMELAGLDGDDPDMENDEMGGQGDSEDEMAGIDQDYIDAEARRNSPMGEGLKGQLDEVLGAILRGAGLLAKGPGGRAGAGTALGYAAGSAGGASSQSTPTTTPSLDHYTIDTSAKMENKDPEQLDEILPVIAGIAANAVAGAAMGGSATPPPSATPSLPNQTINTGATVEEGVCNECGMYGMHESNCSLDEQFILEGKFKEMSMDLEALSDAEFKTKYKMSKEEAQEESKIEPDEVKEDSLIRMRQLSGILIR